MAGGRRSYSGDEGRGRAPLRLSWRAAGSSAQQQRCDYCRARPAKSSQPVVENVGDSLAAVSPPVRCTVGRAEPQHLEAVTREGRLLRAVDLSLSVPLPDDESICPSYQQLDKRDMSQRSAGVTCPRRRYTQSYNSSYVNMQ